MPQEHVKNMGGFLKYNVFCIYILCIFHEKVKTLKQVSEDVLQSSLLPPQPSSDTASCSGSGLTGGPIISDVTDLSQTGMALQMQSNESR